MGVCLLCYQLAPEEHWADAAPDDAPEGAPDGGRDGGSASVARAARHRRTRLLTEVLGPFGITVSDPGAGPHWVIGNRKGAAEVAAALPSVWQAADRLAARPVDVLDAALLDALGEDGE